MKVLYCLCISLFITFSVSAQWTDDVTDNLHVANGDASDIQASGAFGGKTWIAFYSQHGNNYDMRAQLLDSTGKKLFGDTGILVSNKPSGSATYVFNIAVSGLGDLFIGYQIEINGVLNAVVSRVDQNGNLVWGTGVVVGAGLSPYPAVLTSGETIVAWSNSKTNTLGLQKIGTDGTLKIDSAIAVKLGSTGTTRGQVVANDNGDFTLIFQKNGFGINTTLYVQRYNRFLNKLWTAPKPLGSGSTSAARYYSVLAEHDTTYVGYYSSVGFRFNAFLQRINPDEANALPYGAEGTSFSTDTLPNSNYQQTMTIGLIDSNATVWAACTYSDPNQTKYGIYAQRFLKTDGTRLFGDNAKKVYDVSNNLDMQVGELQITGDDRPGILSTDISNLLFTTKLDSKGNIDTTVKKKVLGGTSRLKSRFCFAANDVLAVAVWSEDRGEGNRMFAQNITPDGVSGVFPVVISNFNVVRNGNAADLSWKTLTETNNKGFYIERSADARTFTSIGFVAGKGSINSVGSSYVFSDKLPLVKSNYYRLRQVDNNGKIMYSETVFISFNGVASFIVTRLYPNPAKNVVNVRVQSNVSGKMTMSIVTANGTIVKQQSNVVTAGTQSIPVSVGAFFKGIYYLKVSMNGVEKTISFTKL